MITTVHVSLISQYFELSPLFSIPFIVLYHLYSSLHFFITFCAILLLHVVFIVFLNTIQKVMKTVTIHLFERFVYDEQTDVSLPKFVLGSIASSIRLIARYQSNPVVLLRFMENQKQTRLRTSAFIEICRFLVIFPSLRSTMLDEIKNFSTKSIYNDFILFMFEYLLEQLNSTVMPEIYTKSFDYYYSGFITHSYFYWDARKNKNVCRSFFEAFVCSYFVKETETMINGLFYLYPFVTSLHKYLADILLNINGDFEGYIKEMKFCTSIEKKKITIFDPCLQANAKMNPKILQFCDQYSHILNNISSTSSAMNTISISTNFSLFQRKNKTEKNRNKKKTIASKIVKSERNIPYLHFLNYLFPPVVVVAFVCSTSQLSSEYSSSTSNFNELIYSIQKRFYDLTASIFVNFATQNYINNNTLGFDNCQHLFYSIPLLINKYCENSPILANKTDLLLTITYHEISGLVMAFSNTCEIVSHISVSMDQMVEKSIDMILEENKLCNLYIMSDLDMISKLHNMNLFLLYGSISFIIFLFIYFFSTCFSLNTIMSDNPIAIDFLSSKKRVSPVLQDPETRENLWDQLVGFDSSLNFSDSSPEVDFGPDNEVYTTSASFMSNTIMSTVTLSSANQTNSFYSQGAPNLKFTKSIESALIPPVMLENTDSVEANQDQNLGSFPTSFTGSEANFSELSKLIDPAKIKLEDDSINNNIESTNIDSIIINNNNAESTNLDSIIIDNNNNVNPSKSLSSVNIDQNALQQYSKEVDMNELSVFLNKKRKETKFLYLYAILAILLPWILLYFLALIGYYPLIVGRENAYKETELKFLIGQDFNNVIILLNETITLYKTNYMNFSNLVYVNKTFSDKTIPHMYFKNIWCFDEENCFSVFSVVQHLYEKNYTKEFLEFYALPIITDFAIKTMNSFNDAINGYSYKYSLKSSFLTLSCISLIVSIIVGFLKTKSLKNSLNSLFHFPSFEGQNLTSNGQNEENVNSKSPLGSKDSQCSREQVGSKDSQNSREGVEPKDSLGSNSAKSDILISAPRRISDLKKDEGDLYRFPSNIIIVTSVSESDEIYSISDTCVKIINRKPSDLICRKFSKIFPKKTNDTNFEIREHNGKQFISKTIMIGNISKTVLIEAIKFESKNKSINVIQKLINFMPNFFAKQFSEEFTNFFNFNHCFILFIRMDPNTPQIENFFTLLNRLDQTFFNIDFIRSNGSVLTFICKVKDELEIVLFLRDLITSCEENAKKKIDNYALKSIYIDLISNLNACVIQGDIEPEVVFDDLLFFESEKITYFVNDHYVDFSDESIGALSSISKFSVVKKNVNDKVIHSIPFKLFSSDIILKNL